MSGCASSSQIALRRLLGAMVHAHSQGFLTVLYAFTNAKPVEAKVVLSMCRLRPGGLRPSGRTTVTNY